MTTRRIAAVTAALVMALAGCGGGDDPTLAESPTTGATTTPEMPEPPAASPEPTDGETTSPSPAPTETDATVVEIEVRDGEVVGGVARPEVELGDTVRLVVTADQSDHVHVHGYDLFADLSPGTPATLEFAADIPGQFEIELEDTHLKIAELVVRG